MPILSIDPGVNTGWCLWRDKIPFYKGVITESKEDQKKSLQDRIGLLTRQMEDEWLISTQRLSLVIMERSEFWDSSFRSRTSAKSGALQFLSMVIGSYCSMFFNRGVEVKLISPFQWKGQLSEKLIIQRANEVANFSRGHSQIKLVNSNIHVCCAIGIGAHYLGYKEFNHVKNKTTK